VNVGYSQVNQPTASQLEALEKFAKNPTARVTWSKEVGRIDTGQAKAVVTVLVVEDLAQTPHQMRGVIISLMDQHVEDEVYVGEEFLERLIKALNDIRFFSTSSGSSRCSGSDAFLSAFREGAHVFHASQCSMADGWAGLSVATGRETFRFTSQNPAAFARTIARAREELKLR
jgi:hypothetical protein